MAWTLDPDKLSNYPNLAPSTYQKASDETEDYNCIAYVAGDRERCWWPWEGRYYWPLGVPYEETLEAFVTAFRLYGYEPCDNAELEDQFEKVAVYVRGDGRPTHAAIQGPNGKWKSKLGEWEDIEHELRGVEGPLYGTVGIILRRHHLDSTQ